MWAAAPPHNPPLQETQRPHCLAPTALQEVEELCEATTPQHIATAGDSHTCPAPPLLLQEVEELCEEWQPEPLHGQLSEVQRAQVAPPVLSRCGRGL